MKDRRYYWGDLRLWKTGLSHVPKDDRGVGPQVFLGTDQAMALVVPNSPNYVARLDVKCFFDPYAEADGTFTKKAHRANVHDLVMALRARSSKLHPVCFIDDTTGVTTTVAAGSVFPVINTTMNPNAFAIGDRILIRRNGTDLYSYLTAIGRTVSTVTFAVIVGDVVHAINTGDNMFRVDEAWLGMAYDAIGGIDPEKDGDYYAREVIYPFIGGPTSSYNRFVINRDA